MIGKSLESYRKNIQNHRKTEENTREVVTKGYRNGVRFQIFGADL